MQQAIPDAAALGAIGFSVAALAHLLLLALLVSRTKGRGPGIALLGAIAAEILWAAAWGLGLLAIPMPVWLFAVLEALRSLAWLVFLFFLIFATYGSPDAAKGRPLQRKLIGYGLAVAALTMGSGAADVLRVGPDVSFTLHIAVAVAALVCVEQIWRNTATSQRSAMKFLCLALLAKFSFDLVMYADALLFARLDASWWAARGYANALLVPLIAVSAARNPEWKLDLGVSRKVVFHSATLFSSGIFMLAVALGGYYLKLFGGSWGKVAATMLTFAGAVALLLLLASRTARARARVYISKHFFSYRFDYREEWLNFTERLSSAAKNRGDTADDLASSALAALADLVECRQGRLWMRHPDGSFRCEARVGYDGDSLPELAANDPLIQFLRARDWIIDLSEVKGQVSQADRPPLPAWLDADPQEGILVPLLFDNDLIGVALLQRPRAEISLDWEVRDLLKTAARQAASYLKLRQAVDELVQARQFESFSRMSAFVAHDLKNLVAQLSLLLRNADRHSENPEFRRDMLAAVKNVHARMSGLLVQLHTGEKPIDAPQAVSITKLIEAAVLSGRHEGPTAATVKIDSGLSNAEVTAHKGRLERVLGHLVQNAFEATTPEGMVSVNASRRGGQVLIQISDNGIGMSEQFVRDQLFRPFSSTKKEGMGIGAFETKTYLQEIGGSIQVTSKPDAGTTFSIRLPLRGLNA